MKEQDRVRAKNLFHHFDRVLQIPEKLVGPDSLRCYPCEDQSIKRDKNYLKSFTKVVSEVSEQIVAQNLAKCQLGAEIKENYSDLYERLMVELITKAKNEQHI